jgi:hypothetical protein
LATTPKVERRKSSHFIPSMTVVRTISYTATAASAADAAILKAVATVLDVNLAVVVPPSADHPSSSTATTTVAIACYNAYSNADTELKAVSLTGCVRLLASQTELAVTPEMESWLYATEQTVLPSVRLGECICFLLYCSKWHVF